MADAATTPRRRRSTTKAEQDKAQREAKAAEAAAAKQEESDEASAEELAAQKGRPSNEPQAPEGDAPEVTEEKPGETAEVEFKVGELAPMPKVTSSAKGSVWTDRLNDAAEKIEAAEFPEGQGVAVLVCATPRTAANTANGVRRKISEGKIGGLLGGFAKPHENGGQFTIVTRGRTILVGFKAKA